MDIQILELIDGAKKATGLTVIIDVFRAMTVEAYLLHNGVEQLMPIGSIDAAYKYKKAHPEKLKTLCKQAQILLPNVTEACLLTDIPYQETADQSYYESLIHRLFAFGVNSVMLTGVSLSKGQTGFLYASKNAGVKAYQAPQITGHFHGTGDLFSAVFTGGLLSGLSGYDSGVLAARFVERVLQATKTPAPFGVNFETQLPWLWEQL